MNCKIIYSFIILLLFIFLNLEIANAWSFRLGGLFGTLESYRNKYSPTPVGYLEHNLYQKKNTDAQTSWKLRLSVGVTDLDSTNFEQMVLYGYANDSTNIASTIQTNQDLMHQVRVNGPLSGISKLFVIPLKLTGEHHFKLGKKLPEALVFAGIDAFYYDEKYEQFTSSEDRQPRNFIPAHKTGICLGGHFGFGVKLNKKISINSEYSIIDSTKINTGLNNLEFYFRIE